ncbi:MULTISPECIES: hypothetical protein [Micromonospora]|uniref:Flavin reductase n=1 Tax=Micromonospora yangpuensis TaxID=683228 RepID=A0A1C6V0Z9_9ACTN|nr:hypothetical protein [Micromonospora yangpuensis]GGL97343.1 hypothetical protein GCM10012279_13560 [Micromonospora yangpuensis]SCL59979.1 hypothetical protein GA0070617_4253 [Micromonospora yangpuensis]
MTGHNRGSLTTGRADGGGHLPLRPLWLCRSCAAPWPCATARLTLSQEYASDRTALIVYLSLLLHEADEQLYTLDPAGAPDPRHLFDRFVGWARRLPPVAAPPPTPTSGASDQPTDQSATP